MRAVAGMDRVVPGSRAAMAPPLRNDGNDGNGARTRGPSRRALLAGVPALGAVGALGAAGCSRVATTAATDGGDLLGRLRAQGSCGWASRVRSRSATSTGTAS